MTRVLIPSGALGLGYDRDALMAGIANKPDVIAIDGGSTDSGPSYLGHGMSKYSAASTKAEWRGLMQARAQAGVPLIIGTAGTCGADQTVDWLFEITKEIAEELGQELKVALLYSGQSAATVLTALENGRVTALPAAPAINEDIIKSCSNIVALAGAEQIQAALNTGADIIIAGRTTDTAIIAALPLMRGDHAGAVWHGAKVGECGAIATTQPGTGVIQLDFDATGFTIFPLAETARATPYTVSAHMLYENTDPYILYEPGGHLDATRACYTALDSRTVRVEGSEWIPGAYTVKLEGARIAGYQSVCMAILRERRYVENARQWADDIVAQCCAKVEDRLSLPAEAFDIEIRLIGVDATLGALESKTSTPHEVGVMGIITAQSAELAREIGKMLNPYLLHHPLIEDEPMPTFAFPFSPAEMQRGALYEFCLNHIMALDAPMDAFRLEVRETDHG
ncbi:acyclic terpene utilization AtuA family protein [Candidatus Halocynthiibacter alkanivorans]|uniref:acyclic terpene utilization AtuA family protein n=1 Tax=Candidatus Halocynthiibacter alkanivorans TaxID=2267619 RepID=UPI000DF33F74|nr:acyclic terpene utilization AtuA family protein [Candidatus Halocynthiibacter alkanivorans]